MNSFLRSVAVAASLAVLAAAAPAEAPPGERLSDDDIRIAVGEAERLVQAGRFEEGLRLLAPIPPDRAEDPNQVRFLTGLAASGAARRPGRSERERDELLDLAVAAFRAMLVRDPRLLRVRLELGLAFFHKAEDDLATEQFLRVLAAGPPAPVAANVNRLLAQIRERRRWSGRLGVALAPSTNIGSTSESDVIHLYGLPFRIDRAEPTTSGVGVSLWAGGEYRLPLSGRRRLRLGVDVSRREHATSEFDRMAASVHAGPGWLIGDRTEASLLAVGTRHWLGDGPFRRDLGLRLEGRRRLSGSLAGQATLAWSNRRHDDRATLDGPFRSLSLGVDFRVTPTVRATVSGELFKERPRRETDRSRGRGVRAGLDVALPRGFTVGGTVALQRQDFRCCGFPFTAVGEARADRTRSLRLRGLHRAFVVAGFSPQVSVGREIRVSNAQLQGYQRTFGEVQLVRQF